jgi:inosose dehydratase
MEGVNVACGQLTWDRSYPREKVLEEIGRAGYDGAPVGRSEGTSARETLDRFARYGLRPAPGYLGLDWWTPELKPRQLEQARREAAFSRELGLTDIYVASNLTPARRALAGHVTAQTATSTAELKKLVDLLNELGRITLGLGVRACFHNHVGSPVETRDEIDRLFALVDPSVVYQGPDIGHLAWAGEDVVDFTRHVAPRIKTLHLKDIDPKVRAEGVTKKWDYQTFSDNGIFVELGEGLVDFPALFQALRSAGFRGWIVVETDVTRKASALQSATISRNYLKRIGV